MYNFISWSFRKKFKKFVDRLKGKKTAKFDNQVQEKYIEICLSIPEKNSRDKTGDFRVVY